MENDLSALIEEIQTLRSEVRRLMGVQEEQAVERERFYNRKKEERDRFYDMLYSLPYTHKEIANKLGVSQSAVSHWFSGRNTPSPKMMCAMKELVKEGQNALT